MFDAASLGITLYDTQKDKRISKPSSA